MTRALDKRDDMILTTGMETINRYPTIYNEDTDEEIRIAHVNQICGNCDGEGVHTNPSIGAITSSEWAEWGDDERAGYFDGRYDVTCVECHGDRVVRVADPAGPHFETWVAEQHERAGWAAVEAQERAYGC